MVSAYGTSVQATVSSTTYTPNGRVASATDANGNVTQYGYDGYDRPVTTTYPGGSYEQLGYDARGMVTSRRLRDRQLIGYGYDALGQITTRTASNDAYAWTRAVTVDRSYAMNGLNQYTQYSGVTLESAAYAETFGVGAGDCRVIATIELSCRAININYPMI